MGAFTGIGWCDYTYNFAIGCSRKSICCAKCYAALLDKRRFSMTLPGCSKENPVSHWGPNAPRHRKTADKWGELLKWNAYAESHPWTCADCSEEAGKMTGYTDDVALAGDYLCPKHRVSLGNSPRRVFVGSAFDWAEEVYPDEERDEWFDIMDECTNLRIMLLTKRGPNCRRYLEKRYPQGVPDHYWVGWSWQPDFPHEVDDLLAVKAQVRFVSAEPLLGPLGRPMAGALKQYNSKREIDEAEVSFCEKILQAELLILGGESDERKAEVCNVEWIRSGVRMGEAAGIKVFVKQLGSNPVVASDTSEEGWPGNTVPFDESYVATHQGEVVPLKLRHWKGEDPAEWPVDLRVQEMPRF